MKNFGWLSAVTTLEIIVANFLVPNTIATGTMYKMIPVIRYRLSTTLVKENVRSLIQCAALCTQLESSTCNGFRYNLTQDVENNSCTLGTYKGGGDRTWTFEQGDYITHWRIIGRSADGCLVRYPGYGGQLAYDEFCQRMGDGYRAEIRNEGDEDRLRQLFSDSPTIHVNLGIWKDDDGTWRWKSDNAALSSQLNVSNQECGVYSMATERIIPANCTIQRPSVCQFC